jgi:hypothetical protein
MIIEGRSIERVVLIDDNESVRRNYGYHVDDLDLQPIQIENPFHTMEELFSEIDSATDGVICDYHLNNTTYSPFNGDEIVMNLYKMKLPSLLCSRAAEAAYSVRRYRQFIPNVISANELSPEVVVKSFEICVSEFKGDFRPVRKPYQTLVRIENKEDFHDDTMKVSVVIPGWDTRTMIDIIMKAEDTSLFYDIKNSLNKGEDYRAYATVNLGSESSDEIYIFNWRKL